MTADGLLLILVGVACGILGAAWALSAVGYGVRGGVSQIIRLRMYRMGRCRCGICQPRVQP